MSSVAIRSLRRAIAVAPDAITAPRRGLSAACADSVHKLNALLEEYRSANYTQEFPRRFLRDVVEAARENSMSGDLRGVSADLLPPSVSQSAVSAGGIENVLRNIGMGDRMTRSEIDRIVNEVGTCPVVDAESGERRCVMSTSQLVELISK